MTRERARLAAAIDARFGGLDALVMPTVPILAPRIDALATEDAFMRANMLTLRNTALANFFDLCAVSLPIHGTGQQPVGLMLVGRHGSDARLFAVAAAAEAALASA
jgi:aspartyl-tRNA(Asn)/glutamyl-tRNA(Gln) amidotransferase subunit A